jgi:hypothetical protein
VELLVLVVAAKTNTLPPPVELPLFPATEVGVMGVMGAKAAATASSRVETTTVNRRVDARVNFMASKAPYKDTKN